MPRKITMKALKPLDGAEQDLADQWIDRNWHLPPGGDHSWREREAQRIFGGVDEEPINDKEASPLGQVGPTAGDVDDSYAPSFRRTGALNVILPISLATGAVLFVVAILVPEILTSSFWDPRGPKPLSDAPVRIINGTVAEEHVTPSLAYGGGSNHDGDKVLGQTLPQQVERAVAPAKVYRERALPRPQMPITARHDRQSGELAVRVAKAQSPRAMYPRKLAAKSLPQIGAAYFASHAPAAAARKPLRPIGEAYFGTRSPAATD